MSQLAEVQARAIAALSPRQRYAAAVIRGEQRWSGADLQGKAKRYGAGYCLQRSKARVAFLDAGGVILSVDNGLRVSAVPLDSDRRRFETPLGLAERFAGKARAKIIRGS